MAICVVKQVAGPVTNRGLNQERVPAKDVVNRIETFFMAENMADAAKVAKEKGYHALSDKLKSSREDFEGAISIEAGGDRWAIMVEKKK